MSPTSYRTAPPRVLNEEVYAPSVNMSNAFPLLLTDPFPPTLLIGEPVLYAPRRL